MLSLAHNLGRRRRVDVDAGARNIARLAALARSMPPSWRVGDSDPVLSPSGDYLGQVLPGAGLYLATDLDALGIKRKIPYVFDRSEAAWALDYQRRKLWAAITTYDGIISSRAGGKADDFSFTKASYTTVANVWSSTWQAGGFPAAGTYTAITGGAAHTNATTGALNFMQQNPTGGDKKYLLSFGFTAAQQINLGLLHDLLIGAGNITTNVSTSAQTVNTTALTRQTSGVGVLATFDITTALGATGANVTINSYTNSGGTSGHTTAAVALTGSGIVQRLQPTATGPFIALASGDLGVKSVEQVTVSALMGAGVIALNLYKPLAFIPGIAANIYAERDSTTQIDGLTEVLQTAGAVLGCLNLYVLTNTTSTGILTGFARSCAG